MPPVPMQEEGFTNRTSCPSSCPRSGAFLSRSRKGFGRQRRSYPVQVSQVGGCPHKCPWVGSHTPSYGWQLLGLPSRVEYLSPQGVLLQRVYGMIASPRLFELRGPAALQATPSWAVCRQARHRLIPWLRVTFAMVTDAAQPGSDQ